MARLNVLEYKADFIRGWPHGEAVEMNYPTVGTPSAPLGNGDIVKIVDGGVAEVTTVAATDAYAMIARGQGDTFEQGGTGRGNLYTQVVPNIVLLSNYVVRTSNVEEALTVGTPCYVSATGGLVNSEAVVDQAVFGTVLEYTTGLQDADGNTLDHVAVVLVK